MIGVTETGERVSYRPGSALGGRQFVSIELDPNDIAHPLFEQWFANVVRCRMAPRSLTMLTNQELDAKLAAQTRPRVTLERIHSRIAKTEFLRNDLLTICVLTLVNGFKVTGESACVDAGNYDAMIGDKIARDNAIQKIWPLEGYALADRLHASGVNIHGVGPDVGNGPNPDYRPDSSAAAHHPV